MTAVAKALPFQKSRRRVWIPIGRTVLAVAFFALWYFGSYTMGTEWLPTPHATAERIWKLTISGQLGRDTLVTFTEATLGMIIGGVGGSALPFILRLSPRLMKALEPFLSAAFGVPKLALAPLFILWLGIGMPTKVVFVASIVFFLMFYNGMAGVLSVDPRQVAMARVAGAGEWIITREIVWNTTLPFLFAGLKIGLPRALSGAVVGEFHRRRRGARVVHQQLEIAQRRHRRHGGGGHRHHPRHPGEFRAAAYPSEEARLAPGRERHGGLI